MLGDQDPAIQGSKDGVGMDWVWRWVRSGRQAMLILGVLQSSSGPPAAGRRSECVLEGGAGHEPTGDTHPGP